jgi:putative ABC transport system permease protein
MLARNRWLTVVGGSMAVAIAIGPSAFENYQRARRMFVWQGGRVALIGIVAGLVVAVALSRYIQTLLFNVGRFDALAFAGTAAVMLFVALLASYFPPLRASRVDPVVALRAE